MITFDDVSLNYDARHTALSNINIHIDKGEFVFIVGPSGAGKSTLLRYSHMNWFLKPVLSL